jgi:hypothetical protein
MNAIIFTGSSWINPEEVKDPDSKIYPVLRSIGAYQVANVLRDINVTANVVDFFPYLFFYKYEKLLKIIDNLVNKETLWVGFSSTFFDSYLASKDHPLRNNDGIQHFVNYIKQKNDKIKFILGGATSWKKEFPGIIDFYVEGYADDSIVQLTKYLQGTNPFFMFKNDSVSSDRTAINFNFSDYNFKWSDDDKIKHNEVLPIEISRGCIFKCSYCSYPLNGKKKLDFIKNPNILYDHFIENYERFGVTSYMYTDDTHNDSLEKLEYLYNNVYSRLPFKISFSTYLRLDLIRAHPQMIPLLKDSGLATCFFGIESLNYESNKTVGKGLKPEKTIETLYKLREEWPNVFTQGGFIIGLPNETVNTADKWLELVTDPKFPLNHITTNPLHLFKNQGENGYWFNDIEKHPEKYGYTFSSNDEWISNTGMTKQDAIDLKAQYVNRMLNKNKKISWLTKWRLQNLEISADKYSQMAQSEINIAIDQYIEQYIQKF